MMNNQTYYAGIDIGGTKILTVITDAGGTILGSKKKKTRPEGGFDGVMDRVAECFNDALLDAGVEKTALTGVGVGAPSAITADGIAVHAPNLDWHDLPLQAALQERLGLAVYPENDCNVGTLGEFTFGGGKGAETLVGFFMGTGLGGGVIYKGEMVRGKCRLAGEVGHLVVQAGGRKCGCGNHGCVEAYASKTGMGRRFRKEIEDKKRSSSLKAECNGDYANVRSSILAKAYAAGDEVVQETLQEAAEYLGIAVASVINIVGPDIVVLGGGVFEALGKELVKTVRKSAAKNVFPAAIMDSVSLELATLGDDAVALGAVAYAMHETGHSASLE